MPDNVPYKPRREEWAMPQPFLAPLETDFDGGNTRTRSRPGSSVAIVEQTLRMTPAQFQIFDEFVREDLSNGTSRFTWNVWTGAAYESKTVQFTGDGQPRPANGGLKIAVAMKLRVYGYTAPPPLLDFSLVKDSQYLGAL